METESTYQTGLNSFNTFCLAEGICPLDASTATIVRYISWLGLRGTDRSGRKFTAVPLGYK